LLRCCALKNRVFAQENADVFFGTGAMTVQLC